MGNNKFNKKTNFDYKLCTNSNDDKRCVLKFSSCDDKYPLHFLNKEELKGFISYAKKIESLSWREIKTYSGLNFEALPELKKPDNLTPDITLFSMRVTQKFRIIGYRQDEFFYIVWFDRNHKTC